MDYIWASMFPDELAEELENTIRSKESDESGFGDEFGDGFGTGSGSFPSGTALEDFLKGHIEEPAVA